MPVEPEFAADLYRGTAEAYDRFRRGYPPEMVADLLRRVGVSGRGRLLDLACGTGQLAFAVDRAFVETWAVDQEPEMVRVVAAKAQRGGRNIRAVVASAEDLVAEAGRFELIVVGNAFHRLRRDRVARRMFEWAAPGGAVALCWSDSPWAGPAGWQGRFRAVIDRWRTRLGVQDRLPPGWAEARQSEPDLAVLGAAGFEPVGRFGFEAEHRWTVPELAGFVSSTSFLPAPVVGDRAAEFEEELALALAADLRGGLLVNTASYAYDLVRKPAGSSPRACARGDESC
jgi:SAM-dependent methyltransferase